MIWRLPTPAHFSTAGDFFNLTLLGVTLMDWMVALVIFLLVLMVLTVVRRVLLTRLSKSERIARSDTASVFLDLLKYTQSYLLFAIAFYIASLFITLSDGLGNIVHLAVIALVLLQAGVWGSRLIAIFISRSISRREGTDLDNTAAINLLGLLARVVLWIIILLLILNNIKNFDISALVASLGISGIAVAFALQRILGDLFASFSIALDKPFVVGDFIVVGDKQGTVENIGLKSTRVRSLTGEQIIFSNSDLLASRIQNFKRMKERRVDLVLKLSVKTPYEKLAEIPKMLQAIIEDQPSVRFDRAHFSEIGDNFLKYEVVYYLLSPDYDLYMDAQQNVNLAVIRVFEREQVPFAFQ
jgi:small-conductance mechanosensitive channel